jgi:beta-lactamase class A
MSGVHVRPWRWLAAAAAVLTALAVSAVVLVKMPRLHRSTHTATNATSSPIPSVRPSTRPQSSPATRIATHAPAVTPRAHVERAIGKLSTQLPAGGVSVAALNTTTGAHYGFGATGGMRTGSVYKLLVLEALLLQHQDQGTPLGDSEMALAAPMMENSDNVAGYQLFLSIGGNSALAALGPRLGLRHTIPGQANPAFTTTSAQDSLALLRNLVRNGPLNQYSRSLTLDLMQHVVSDQRWGVGAVADPGTGFANKNGWLQVDNGNGLGENDDGRLLVNSVGIVTVRHQQVLMTVFTQHGDYSLDEGIELVESLAKAIAPAVVAR